MLNRDYIIDNYRSLLRFDARAEVLFEALIKRGLQEDDISVRPGGLFYRKYSKDLMAVTRDNNDEDLVNINISRDGIYDVLPQSLTHNYKGRELREDPVQDFKSRKREEREARHFFNPLENEFFRFRHEIEKFESAFFATLTTGGVADIIKTILGIEKQMPDHLVVKLFYALMKQKDNPVTGTDELCRILAEIIGEEVTYTADNITLEHNFDIEEQDDMIMGVTTTLASSEKIFLKKLHFKVGPLARPANLPLYFTGEELENFLTAFFNLFIPVHSQFSFEIKLYPEDEMFSMDDELIYKSRLGISTVL